jgi:hypothetical protein
MEHVQGVPPAALEATPVTWLRLLASAVFLVAALPGVAAEQAVLWQAPGRITMNDWIWGPGGESGAPKPPFTFVDEDFHGTNPKIRVRDAEGRRWTVKFGGEVHGDVFGSRLLYATGYLTEPNYYVASGTIAGVHDLKRAEAFVGRHGFFRFARFKLRDHKALAPVHDEEWSWNQNPFTGTPQVNGLKILIMLTSNWDTKDARDGKGSNTGVYSNPGRNTNQRFYAFDDWGASMGKWGGFFERDKWNPAGYEDQTKDFARLSAAGRIEWGYKGKHYRDITSGISVDDVRWLLTYLSPVTDEELRAGLRASGATEAQIEIYTRSIRQRITQLQQLAIAAEPATTATNRGRN